jgi:hypothetical protein
MRKTLLVVAIAVLLSAGRASAFVCLRTSGGACLHWANGAATMGSFLGGLGRGFSNGTLSFDQNAINAGNDWTGTGAAFHFTVGIGQQFNSPCGAAGPQHVCANTGPAGDNPVFFTNTVCGGGFGDIIAQTDSCFDRNSGALINTPVFINNAVAWDAYDGPAQQSVYDIHRVLLHEFGHVLGLDHPDSHGQTVIAIMNSHVSDLERLQPDDVAGIFSLYPNTGPSNAGANTGCQMASGDISRRSWLLLLPAALMARRRRHG